MPRHATMERERSAAPSTPQTQLCRALKAAVRRRSAAAVSRHQGEGEERRALDANEGGKSTAADCRRRRAALPRRGGGALCS